MEKYISTIFKICILLWFIIILMEVKEIKHDIDQIKRLNVDTVTVTTYAPVAAQTDATPFITASGFKLHKNPRKQRVIAVSRDLKRKMRWGQRVRVEGTGKYDGIYVVEDVMNRRFKKRIDILINPSDKPTMFKNIKLYKV